jgi:hypothetical protein
VAGRWWLQSLLAPRADQDGKVDGWETDMAFSLVTRLLATYKTGNWEQSEQPVPRGPSVSQAESGGTRHNPPLWLTTPP